MIPGRPPSFWHSSPICQGRLLELRWHAWRQAWEKGADERRQSKSDSRQGRAVQDTQAGCRRWSSAEERWLADGWRAMTALTRAGAKTKTAWCLRALRNGSARFFRHRT